MRTKEAIQCRIYQLCDQQGLSVSGLGKMCGITQSTLNNITRGRNNSTTIGTIKKICDGLHMEIPDFFNSDLFRNLEQEVL